MNAVDLCIIILLLLLLLFGFLIGWHNGLIKQSVLTIGLVLVICLAFILKNPVSSLFYRYLPFINFSGAFKGVSVLNIILYEFLAFVITFTLLLLIFKILVKTSSIIEKILKATIILGIPSKILGGIVGLIENFIIVFIVLYFLNLPILNFSLVNESKFAKQILNKTPILSNVCNDTLILYDEIESLKNEYIRDTDKTELNNKILKLLLDKDFVSQENVNYLITHKKLQNIELEKGD